LTRTTEDLEYLGRQRAADWGALHLHLEVRGVLEREHVAYLLAAAGARVGFSQVLGRRVAPFRSAVG